MEGYRKENGKTGQPCVDVDITGARVVRGHLREDLPSSEQTDQQAYLISHTRLDVC